MASLTVHVQDVATADELFKRALAVDCTNSNVSGSYVEFFQKHLEADYRFCCCSVCLLIFDPCCDRIGDMFKKAVDLFPSCAPLLRSFAAYCDNGKSHSRLLT